MNDDHSPKLKSTSLLLKQEAFFHLRDFPKINFGKAGYLEPIRGSIQMDQRSFLENSASAGPLSLRVLLTAVFEQEMVEGIWTAPDAMDPESPIPIWEEDPDTYIQRYSVQGHISQLPSTLVDKMLSLLRFSSDARLEDAQKIVRPLLEELQIIDSIHYGVFIVEAEPYGADEHTFSLYNSDGQSIGRFLHRVYGGLGLEYLSCNKSDVALALIDKDLAESTEFTTLGGSLIVKAKGELLRITGSGQFETKHGLWPIYEIDGPEQT